MNSFRLGEPGLPAKHLKSTLRLHLTQADDDDGWTRRPTQLYSSMIL